MSGRMTCSGMPERRATVRTWWGGTSFHPETVGCVIPHSLATRVTPPLWAMMSKILILDTVG